MSGCIASSILKPSKYGRSIPAENDDCLAVHGCTPTELLEAFNIILDELTGLESESKRLDAELAELKAKSAALKKHWQAEKAAIMAIGKIKELMVRRAI